MIRILVIDDEKETCQLLKEFLTKKGYDVATVSEADKVIEIVKTSHPQLVLLDIRMPQKDGITLLKEIKEIDKEIGVIMVTAVRDEATAKKSLELGADGYITKPIDLNYLETNVLVKRLLL